MRIATFNILHGRSPSDDRVDVDRFADAIAALDADVLALQEVDRDQPRSLGADLTGVAAGAMGAVESRFVAALAGMPGLTWQAATGHEQPGTAAYGIAVLSRYPVRHWQTLRLPALPLPVPYRHHGQSRPHLVKDEARVAALATVQLPFGDVLVAATHLSYLPGWNLQQLRRLSKTIRASSGPAVLLGDLNMTPEPAERITRMQPLATGVTFPAESPSRQIDHILGRDMPPVTSSATVELPVSDHLALYVDLATPDEPT